jgi:hypothetical protein
MSSHEDGKGEEKPSHFQAKQISRLLIVEHTETLLKLHHIIARIGLIILHKYSRQVPPSHFETPNLKQIFQKWNRPTSVKV